MEGNTMMGIIETKTLDVTIVRCLISIFEDAELNDNVEPTSLQDLIEDIDNHGNVWG